jgi:hypothetical protein
MKRPKSSAKNPLSPKWKWLVVFCRTRSILRNATSFVIRSIRQTWSPTCSYASTLWRPAPKLSYGTRLPGAVNKGLTAIRALYRHILQNARGSLIWRVDLPKKFGAYTDFFWYHASVTLAFVSERTFRYG